jgi:hypothetical protein
MPKLKPEHKLLKRLMKTIVLLVVIAGLGVGAYLIGSHYNNASTPPPKAKTAASTNRVSSPTQQYTSNNQNLSFTYPSGWKVNETTDIVTGTSPAMQLTNTSRQAVTGQIIFRIRAQTVALDEFNAGAATAALDSQLLNYTAPATGQQASAYISFLSYANSKSNGIDGIYVTGNSGYLTGQQAPKTDIAAVNPIISFTFAKCANKTCKGNTAPLTIAANSWSAKNFSSPLLAILKSLALN